MRLALLRDMGTPRNHRAQSSLSLISEVVPTHSDEVTNVTRLEMARVLLQLEMTNDTSTAPTAMEDNVFADVFEADTLELYIDYDPTL